MKEDFYGGLGVYVDWHILLIGFSSSISAVMDGEGEKVCTFRTDCGSLGPGLFGGSGVEFPFGIAFDSIETSLTGNSISFSFDIGVCFKSFGSNLGIGFNEEGLTSVGSAKGPARLGTGCGGSLTVDFCETTLLFCNDL